MIKLSVECPTIRIGEWSSLTDLDFALAHKVLRDDRYADLYLNRVAGRELILDNSFHELGHPLDIDDLLEAAELVNADYVISPDLLDDPDWTLEQFDALSRRTIRTAVVLGGETPEFRSEFLRRVQPASMLCLPYRRPRLEWFLEQRPPWPRIHLLGVSSLLELSGWVWLSQLDELSGIQFSVDTAKPVKWGLLGRSLQESPDRSLRHAPISSADLLELGSLTPEQDATIEENIRFIRSMTWQ